MTENVYFGYVRVGRLSKKKLYHFLELCENLDIEVSDIYVHKSGLLSVTYAMTLVGEFSKLLVAKRHVEEFF